MAVMWKILCKFANALSTTDYNILIIIIKGFNYERQQSYEHGSG